MITLQRRRGHYFGTLKAVYQCVNPGIKPASPSVKVSFPSLYSWINKYSKDCQGKMKNTIQWITLFIPKRISCIYPWFNVVLHALGTLSHHQLCLITIQWQIHDSSSPGCQNILHLYGFFSLFTNTLCGLLATTANPQKSCVSCLWELAVFSQTLFLNQLAAGWVTRKMASSQRQQMASVSAVGEWVGGPDPNDTPRETHTFYTCDFS